MRKVIRLWNPCHKNGEPVVDRQILARDFLAQAGWGTAGRAFLAGDASDRSYYRLTKSDSTAVLMDAPPDKGDDPAVFLAIASYLRGLGLSAPDCYAHDLPHGFLLLEDLGDDLFAKRIPAQPNLERTLYQAATDVLLHLHRNPPPENLPDLTATDWADAAGFALTWYRFAITNDNPDITKLTGPLGALISRHADGPRVTILRDYHAENLLWLPERDRLARVGLLDFQLAQLGQPGYDLVSLLQDARRDVPPDVEQEMITHFCDATGRDHQAFLASYAVLGAQRALRILGIFARLCLRGGKAGYVPLIPRVWALLERNLTHPALSDLAQICHEILPTPTPDSLQRITRQCGSYPTR